KVNNKLVPINYVLKNGDQIEILTSQKQRPNTDWLRYVVTSKAKTRIKDALKEDKRKIAEDGKEIVMRKLRQLKLEPTQGVLESMREFFSAPSNFDLYYRVGNGIITTADIKRFRDYKPAARSRPSIDPRVVEVDGDKIRDRYGDVLLVGDDMDVVDYRLAKCCTPIPGDDVFGFVTVNEGIKIHRTSCPNAPELLSQHGNRVVKARWTSQQEVAFLTGLKIRGTDRVGLINDVSKVISEELKVNMSSMSMQTDTGIFEGEIMLYVHDTRHLEERMNKLKNRS